MKVNFIHASTYLFILSISSIAQATTMNTTPPRPVGHIKHSEIQPSANNQSDHYVYKMNTSWNPFASNEKLHFDFTHRTNSKRMLPKWV